VLIVVAANSLSGFTLSVPSHHAVLNLVLQEDYADGYVLQRTVSACTLALVYIGSDRQWPIFSFPPD
jgi:hypothetical protein